MRTSSNDAVPLPLWWPVVAATGVSALSVAVFSMFAGADLSVFGVALAFGAGIGFVHTMLFGIAYAYCMHRMHCFNALTMTVGGFAIGAIPLGLVVQDLEAAALFGCFGAIAALVFQQTSRRLSAFAAARRNMTPGAGAGDSDAPA